MGTEFAYGYGYDVGYNIAVENRFDYNLADEDERERFITEMLEFESDTYRQYSPFEFFASELNSKEDNDEQWEAYDTGVYDGISALVKEEVALIKGNHE